MEKFLVALHDIGKASQLFQTQYGSSHFSDHTASLKKKATVLSQIILTSRLKKRTTDIKPFLDKH